MDVLLTSMKISRFDNEITSGTCSAQRSRHNLNPKLNCHAGFIQQTIPSLRRRHNFRHQSAAGNANCRCLLGAMLTRQPLGPELLAQNRDLDSFTSLHLIHFRPPSISFLHRSSSQTDPKVEAVINLNDLDGCYDEESATRRARTECPKSID